MRPGLPSIAADASAPPVEALAAVRGAARARGRTLVAACVDGGTQEAVWRELLCNGGEAGGGEAGEGCGGDERPAAVALFTTACARDWLVAAETTPVATATAVAAAAAGGDDGGGEEGGGREEEGGVKEGSPATGADDLVTCLFSFGSTGQPKPLWFDATRCGSTRSPAHPGCPPVCVYVSRLQPWVSEAAAPRRRLVPCIAGGPSGASATRRPRAARVPRSHAAACAPRAPRSSHSLAP